MALDRFPIISKKDNETVFWKTAAQEMFSLTNLKQIEQGEIN